jgi:hypothetical protein
MKYNSGATITYIVNLYHTAFKFCLRAEGMEFFP